MHSLAAHLGYEKPNIVSPIGHKTHSIASSPWHYADAVLLAAGDVEAQAAALEPPQVTPPEA
jgi:hypothetical protein